MNLGLIGCGKMGSALVSGILTSETVSIGETWIHDPYEPAMKSLQRAYPDVRVAASNLEVANRADVLLLCLKPAGMEALAKEIASAERSSLCISVAAGVSIALLEPLLGEQQRLVRVMPNTPALVGAGASGFALGQRAKPEDATLTRSLLEAVGIAHEVNEGALDAVTGVSGSGPAYIYLVIEAMADAGVLNGLPRPMAQQLAAQTVLGAAKMVLETGEHPGVLKDQVASPGGTTIRGIASLEKDGLRAAMIGAVNTAVNRSIEMGQS